MLNSVYIVGFFIFDDFLKIRVKTVVSHEKKV